MSETCIVRPELIEFDKGNSEYLSIIAHPTVDSISSGFRFTSTTLSTSTMTNINEGGGQMIYTDNLANLHAYKITLNDASVKNILDLETLTFASGVVLGQDISLAGGNIAQMGSLTTNGSQANH